MARYQRSFATRLPAEAAFARVSDVTRFIEWDPSVKRAVRVAGDGTSIGTVYELVVEAGGVAKMRYEVTAYEAPRRMVMVARTFFLTSVDEVRVIEAGAGSIVTYDARLSLNGPLALLDPLLDRAFRRIGDRAATGLARFLAVDPAT